MTIGCNIVHGPPKYHDPTLYYNFSLLSNQIWRTWVFHTWSLKKKQLKTRCNCIDGGVPYGYCNCVVILDTSPIHILVYASTGPTIGGPWRRWALLRREAWKWLVGCLKGTWAHPQNGVVVIPNVFKGIYYSRYKLYFWFLNLAFLRE